MATLLIPSSIVSSPSASLAIPTANPRAYFRPSHVPFYQGLGFRLSFSPKTRGLALMTRAGPSTSSYVFAFVLPLSLLAITVVASIRVSDRLDRQFLEELILNEAMREADEEDEEEEENIEDGEVKTSVEKVQEPVLPRTRNRPKREV